MFHTWSVCQGAIEDFVRRLGFSVLGIESDDSDSVRQTTISQFNDPSNGCNVLVTNHEAMVPGINIRYSCWRLIRLVMPGSPQNFVMNLIAVKETQDLMERPQGL